jgi:putative two-component system response regulator
MMRPLQETTRPRVSAIRSLPREAPPTALPAFHPMPARMLESSRHTILLVDPVDVNRSLLKGILKAGSYRLLEARNPVEAMAVLDREGVDLIIAEVMMPEISGMEFCSRVKKNRRTQLVPVLLVTNLNGVENEVAGLESGADEFLTKPLHPLIVRTRVRAMLRNKMAFDSLEEAETILFALAQTIEQRDKETSHHCQRLAALSVALGIAIGLPEEDLVALHRGGYLHDIGKIAVPDEILFKQGRLTDDEWVIMRGHTLAGEAICRPMKSLSQVLPIIRNHHEKWDGTGYPDALAGEEIPLLARVLQLADIYDALTSARSYKEAFQPARAIEILEREAGEGWRDPELVSVFCEIVRQPGFLTRGTELFAAQTEETESDEGLKGMRESLSRMSRELLR